MSKNSKSNFSKSLGFFASKALVLVSALFDVALALVDLVFAFVVDVFDMLTGFIDGLKPEVDNKSGNKRTKRGR